MFIIIAETHLDVFSVNICCFCTFLPPLWAIIAHANYTVPPLVESVFQNT